jgi:hypothetical protein
MATKSQTRAKDHAAGDIKATNLTDDDKQFIAKHRGELSDSTLRARWTHSPDEHADRPGQTLATRSPNVIEAWAKERGGQPATVPGTEHNGHPGVLRFEFGRGGNDRLQEISWDDWLRTFHDRQLVFLYQETTSDGNQSNFFHLDSPTREHE